MFNCQAPRNTSHAHHKKSSISSYVTTLPLLTERLNTSCQYVMCQSLQMMASTHCSNSGWTNVTWQPKRSFACFRTHHSFHPATSSASVRLLQWTLQRHLWMFPTSSQHAVCRTHHWLTTLTCCCNSAVRNLYIIIYKCLKLEICFV